ncbi:MAG: hypothetical protein IPO48_06305 [Saprospiraceae bacterium]|nr:hypothetical protein [Saprospiraceae bacterium]
MSYFTKKVNTFAALYEDFSNHIVCFTFCQSMSVCGPAIGINQNSNTTTECNANPSSSRNYTKKKCCSHKEKSNQKKDTKKGCCGDNCQCLTCAKVFIPMFQYTRINIEDQTTPAKKVVCPVFFHGFDFHASIGYPPNI